MKGKALKEFIRELGGPTSVAKRLRNFRNPSKTVSTAAVSKWRQVPAKRCLEIAALSGGKYSPNDLRPDVFGKVA